MINLPKEFLNKIERLLGDETEGFLETYHRPSIQGLRVNTNKISISSFQEISPFSLMSIPWADMGFYYETGERPGKHPYHEAGLYYLQEPSAMLPGIALDAKKGERVLDLCGAPGGKTTQIAGMMEGKGILISNEIHPQRARVLSQNVERMGLQNVIVLNEEPAKLAEKFESFFDRILVDAPCSGEGMFHKDQEAIGEWSLENVQKCSRRQKDILKEANKMLQPGGRLVYSTCTFSKEENEDVISWFLNQYPEYFLISFDKEPFMGQSQIRLWPHKIKGEGHFVALLQKEGSKQDEKNFVKKEIQREKPREFLEFEEGFLNRKFSGHYLWFGNHLYYLEESYPELSGLRVIRPGLHLGESKKGRFEPSHSLFCSLKMEEAKYAWQLKDEDQVAQFLHGEALQGEAQSGWNGVFWKGYSLGFGKYSNGVLKNHYPKGLRK